MKPALIAFAVVFLLFACSALAGAGQPNSIAGIDLETSPFGSLAKALVRAEPLKIDDFRPRGAACVQSGQLVVAPGPGCTYDLGRAASARGAGLRLASGNGAQISLSQGNLRSD